MFILPKAFPLNVPPRRGWDRPEERVSDRPGRKVFGILRILFATLGETGPQSGIASPTLVSLGVSVRWHVSAKEPQRSARLHCETRRVRDVGDLFPTSSAVALTWRLPPAATQSSVGSVNLCAVPVLLLTAGVPPQSSKESKNGMLAATSVMLRRPVVQRGKPDEN